MKNFTLLFLLMHLGYLAFGQTATPPTAGDGSSGNPYQIATLENLYWLSQNSSEWTKDYVQTAYIDASETATWDDGDGGDPEGFSPIGNSTTKFRGSYNGQGYAIDGLTINRPESNNVGLFGYASVPVGTKVLSNIVLWGANITGNQTGTESFSGAICGYASGTSILNCKVSYAQVDANYVVGGLCGYVVGSEISGCYVYETSVVFSREGGLIAGRIHSGCTVTECFGTGTVDGGSLQGGLVGVVGSDCSVEDCYTNCSIIEGSGLVSVTYGPVNRCYSASEFTNTSGSMAVITNVVTSTGGSATNLYYDSDLAAGVPDPFNYGTGKTTIEMQTQGTYTGWDFTNTWAIDANQNNGGYPYLQNTIPPYPPVISISSTEVTGTSIEVTVNISNFGNSNPTRYGVCYNTSGDPTTADAKVEQTNPPTTGEYNITISGLSTLTDYFIRAYAVNDDGPGYSDAQSVTSGPEGSGTEGDPYLVPDLATLRWISETSDQWDKYYLQTANIDASQTSNWNLGDHDDNAGTPDEYMGFSPIGNVAVKFTGKYDGDNFAITELFINRPVQAYIGLFGYSSGPTLNLNMVDVNITGYIKVGGLAGSITYEAGDEITGCSSSGNVYSTFQSGTADFGGLLGYVFGGTVSGCYSTANVSGYSRGGGLIGYCVAATVSNSFSSGTVTEMQPNEGDYMGGLIGGLSGNVNSTTLVENCYSTSVVDGYYWVGGLVGQIQNSYPTVNNCYSSGSVSGTFETGGLIGINAQSATVSNSFWDTQASGQSSSAGGTGKTTTEMTTQSTFTDAGWDFVAESTNGNDDIWAIYAYYNDGYPVFDATPQPPAVETNDASSVTTSGALLNGNILNLGSENPTQHGFVWSTTSNPTLDDNYSEQGAVSNTGAYTHDLTGLLPGKTYYIKAYAINAVGTAYGDEISFTTNSESNNYYIDYKIQTDDFYAQTKESGIQGNADPVWRFRGQAGAAYSAGAWSSWDCLYDVPGSQAYRNGAWYNQPTVERWSGTVLNNADNIYIGIEGWEDEDQNYCTYNSGTDENYSSDSYYYHSNLDEIVTRATWENFRNAQQSNVDYVDCGTDGNDNYFKIEFDVWWDYSLPVDISFSLSDASYDGFTININGFNNYRVNTWDYEIRDDGNNLITELTGLEYSAVEVTGLDMGTDYYVKVRGTNEAGTGDYSSAQSISTLIPTINLTASLTNFSTSLGNPSASQSFTVSGSNLLDDVTVEALGDFEYSTDDASFSSPLTLAQSNGSLAETTVYVRLAGSSAGIFDGDIVISSTDANEETIAVTGSTTSPNALNFDGTDDYVDCGNNTSVQITGTAFTLEAWIKADTWASEVWNGTIICKESPGTGYFLRCGDEGLLNVGFGDGSNGHETTTSTGLMVANRWYHIAGIYDGTTLKLYINGAEVASENYTQSVGNNGENLLIGQSPYFSGRFFDGTIDEVRVWNIARTQTEIHDNMYNELNGDETGLVAYYSFDQGNPDGDNTGETTLYDQTSNNNDGSLSGPFALTGNSSNWVISGAFSPTIIWDGSEGTNWAEADNWSNGYVPGKDDHVIIPATSNDPQINSGTGASCINLETESGANLTISHGGSLITTGTITNNGTINIELSVGDGEWHLVSIPTRGITANTFLDDYLQQWDETVPEWIDITDPEASLNTNIGYALWATGSKSSYTFTGTPLSGEQTSTVTLSDNFSTDEGNDGANLLGNPYPSSIDWSGLDDTWGAVYYWDPSANSGAGDYLEWNDGVGSGSQYIPPLQGFFIVVDESNTTEGSGTFSLSNENRTHSGAAGFYKSKIHNGLVLEARSGDNTDELFFRINEDASPGFDLQHDALKFFSGVEGISQIYSFGEGRKLAIDTRPETEVIQLGFINETAGFYSISVREMDNISKALLEDTKINIIHDLTKSAYEFAWDVNDDEKRFKLHLNAVGIEETPVSESNIVIYAANNQIFIKGMEKGEVIVSDIMGRVILQDELSVDGSIRLPGNLQTGIYLVTVQNGKEIKTEKVYIR
jgi:hypothetical protein